MPARVNGQVNGTADTLRILVATDNHVGHAERDPVRGDDSWKTFDEIMRLAKSEDVDCVLLGGDLFHENVPSRKSMYNVLRALRQNCYGDKPCEVEFRSDASKLFDPVVGKVNYYDENINVAIPVFSIHGNHDDPSGDGHYAALDLIQMGGLINYFGLVPQADDFEVNSLCLQKGNTVVQLFGISNVRDERLYQTFKAAESSGGQHGVKFSPLAGYENHYNICVVHQNHHAHSATGYLPENFLPGFLDLVIWGHEHECIIDPSLRPDLGFRVMQPGSSVATSLAPGEAVPKHVAILNITGQTMKCETIRLKTVRPFVYRDVVLSEEKEVMKIMKDKLLSDDHRSEVTRWLQMQVKEMIEEAKEQWLEAREDDADPDEEMPLPLIRVRVDHTGADGVSFEMENPHRFSQRFAGEVANTNDVLQLHVSKKKAAAMKTKNEDELRDLLARPEEAENIKVNRLVADFLAAQSLTILPQFQFGDAVNQYIDKDDKHAMEIFVDDTLAEQMKNLMALHPDEDIEDMDLPDHFKVYAGDKDKRYAAGQIRLRSGKNVKYKPKPDDWDSDDEGHWEDQPAALIRAEDARADEDEFMSDTSDGTPQPAARGKTRGTTRARARGARGGATRARGTTAAKKTTTSRSSASTTARGKGRKKAAVEESEEEDEDELMTDLVDDDEEDESIDSQAMFIPEKKVARPAARTSREGSVASSTTSAARSKPAARPASSTTKASSRSTPSRAAATRTAKQSTLKFTGSQASVFGSARSQPIEVSDIDDSDEDAFEPAIKKEKPTQTKRKR